MKIFIPALIVLLLVSCSKTEIGLSFPEENVITVGEYSFDSEDNSALMFQDGEAQDVLTSSDRSYSIGAVLQVKAISNTMIQIANFAPVDIDSATILIAIDGQPKAIQLFKIKKIRAHAIQQIEYPFIKGDTTYLDVDGDEVNLGTYKNVGLHPDKVTFDFTGENALVKKLKSLSKLKWQIRYHDYDSGNNPKDNWKEDIDAKDVRRFTGLMINLAYLFQAEQTKAMFLDEPIIGNDGTTFMTLEQKQQAFQTILDINQFTCGVVVNVSGLGGGSVFGVADHILKDYLKYDVSFIAVHEIGHMIGYSHSSTMTYPKDNQGAIVATGRVYNMMLANKDFPVRTENYYKASDF